MADAKGDVKGLDAGPDPAKKIFLVSGDGKKFEVSLSAAMMSVFVKTALDMGEHSSFATKTGHGCCINLAPLPPHPALTVRDVAYPSIFSFHAVHQF